MIKRIMLPVLLILVLCIGLCSCGSESAEKDTIGIIAALDFELEIIKENMEDMQTEEIAGTEYYLGTIGNHNVICMKCGMGKVSASLGAQAMITQYHPDCIINTGCAGALSHELNVGDMIIAEKTVEWDLDTIDLGNPRGYVSAMDQIEMTADADISDKIAGVIEGDAEVYRGMIVSGDQFVSSDEQRKLILDEFPDALCAEMEGGAIGHVCEQNGVPFCVIRCISDNADGDSGVDFSEFSEEAGEKSAGYLLEYLAEY